MTAAMIELQKVGHRYPGQPAVESLRDVDLIIHAGELVAVMGPSGSGKTTLLHIVGTLDRPTSGTVRIAGLNVSGMSDRELSGFRAARLGFVFQQFFLLDGMSVLDNVAAGLLYRGLDPASRRRAALEALDRVGLGHRLRHRPGQLSGGERQRTAIARAIAGRPAVVLADEPTGNLDSLSGAGIVDALRDLNRDGTTVIVITHSPVVAGAMHRTIEIKDGRIEADSDG
ncbi:MAG TPA: ABC transporter ATP-binding protein [Candidatus Dormibacteraeota bacterium]|nr:ABC transporter ATP-binding protein [Candidatus Dormibacteraeota bacterium]